jgi:CRP-like cAMP-binding protein
MILGVKQISSFSEADLYIMSQYFKPISYEKDTIILNIGEINDKMFFVEEGVLQEFSYHEKDQINTHWLIPEGGFMYSTVSFIYEVPTEMGIKAIENVKLLYITKQDLQIVYEKVPQMERVGRLLTEQILIGYEKFLNLIRYNSSTEKLAWFEETFPTLGNRIPQKYIASYLNIRPETLSRVRSKRARR